MPESTIISRLRELDGNLLQLARARRHMDGKDVTTRIGELSADLAAVITDLDQPSAGTSAYEMVAASEAANVEVTETLIQMTAATVLHKLIEEEGGGRCNISFTPKDMDEMYRLYDMTAKRDGMMTTVTISARPGFRTRKDTVLVASDEAGTPLPMPPAEAHLEDRPEALMRQDEPETPFEPQAEAHTYDKPLWAARVNGVQHPASDRDGAERIVRRAFAADANAIAQVENVDAYDRK